MTKSIDWKDLVCEEASIFSVATKIDCGAPAAALVWHQRDRRAYTMCLMCADHNLRNRGGILLATSDVDLLNRYASPVVIEPKTKKVDLQVGTRVELMEEFGFWHEGTIGIVVGSEWRSEVLFYWVDKESNRLDRHLMPGRLLKVLDLQTQTWPTRLPTIKEAFDQERSKLLRGKSLLEHFTEEIAFGIDTDKSAKEIAINLIATIDQWLPPSLKVDK